MGKRRRKTYLWPKRRVRRHLGPFWSLPPKPSFLSPQHTSSPSLLLLSCGCVVVVVAAWLSWLYAEADSEHVMNKFKLHY